jgi:hypothetical protein
VLYRLPQWENRDHLDTILIANRLLAHGAGVWWLPAATDDAEAGDHLVDISGARHAAITGLGITLAPHAGAPPDTARELTRPSIALFSGTASRYPYDGYYALTLFRLGCGFRVVDGPQISRGALRDANILVIPGGFATWGIDRAEDTEGADAEVRAFLTRGGGALGSCGGAYYLSAGRPDWTGTANAKPVYTHEYLQSGVGVVDVALAPGPIRAGCPPTMEVPYYHGPTYGELGDGITVAGTLSDLVLPGAVGIPNPLDRAHFDRDMKGRPAILLADGRRGRAVLFSPHPEMGDIVRKYIALDGYVRKYLPIRGRATLHDTLRHYRVADAPSFRLVANAIAWLTRPTEPASTATDARLPKATTCVAHVVARLNDRVGAIRVDDRTEDERTLIAAIVIDLSVRLSQLAPRLDRATARLAPADTNDRQQLLSALHHYAEVIAARLDESTVLPATQELMEVELAVTLVECWARCVEVDAALKEVA